MKYTRIIVITITILILIIVTSISFGSSNITGKSIDNISNTYKHTKAICNKENFCQDHLITCKNNQAIKIDPIEDAYVYHPKNWTDPRSNPEKLC